MTRIFVAAALALALAVPAVAGPQTDALGVCLVDALNGKERKELAKWVFFAMSAHPEMADHATVTAEQQNDIDTRIGALVTRLLAKDCAPEAKAAIAADGSPALEASFGLVGQVAMQELMNHAAVNASIYGFQKHLDNEKLKVLD